MSHLRISTTIAIALVTCACATSHVEHYGTKIATTDLQSVVIVLHVPDDPHLAGNEFLQSEITASVREMLREHGVEDVSVIEFSGETDAKFAVLLYSGGLSQQAHVRPVRSRTRQHYSSGIDPGTGMATPTSTPVAHVSGGGSYTVTSAAVGAMLFMSNPDGSWEKLGQTEALGDGRSALLDALIAYDGTVGLLAGRQSTRDIYISTFTEAAEALFRDE